MKKLYLKGEYKIIGDMYSNLSDDPPRIVIPVMNKENVTLIIRPQEKKVEASQKIQITDALYNMFQSIKSGKHNKEEKKETIDEYFYIRNDMKFSVKVFLTRVKYFFNWKTIDDQKFQSFTEFWSQNKKDWNKLVNIQGKVTCSFQAEQMVHLDVHNIAILERDINRNDEPFVALKHLQRAEKETDPRHKWIDATIAAELAIKEFLIKLKPDFEVLLLEIPSPPLPKLYGSILKRYAGEKSPKLKQIDAGAQRRNRLIHRPNEESVSTTAANEYVSDIRDAIIHLYSLLYPHREITKIFGNLVSKTT